MPFTFDYSIFVESGALTPIVTLQHSILFVNVENISFPIQVPVKMYFVSFGKNEKYDESNQIWKWSCPINFRGSY